MPETADHTALEGLLRPLSRQMTTELAHAVVGLEADHDLQARYDDLAERRTEGRLTADEQTELESLVQTNTLLGVLKAEARLLLSAQAS